MSGVPHCERPQAGSTAKQHRLQEAGSRLDAAWRTAAQGGSVAVSTGGVTQQQHGSAKCGCAPSNSGASPMRAAEMLPTVTDMFSQCRKVRSLAAGQRETQVRLVHGWQQRQGQLPGAGAGRDQGRHSMAPHAA